MLLFGWITWFTVPRIVARARTDYYKFRAWALIKRPPPEWQPQPVPTATHLELLQRPKNEGFGVVREDRVWDLRRLTREGRSGEVRGPALMTRFTTLMRESDEVREYVYWFETSGSTFTAWTLNREFPLRLFTQVNPVVSGASLVRPWELRMDVSAKGLREPLILMVQAQVTDAFVRRSNWWISMKVIGDMEAASMRILFPRSLRYRNAEFMSHPNDTPSHVGDV